jgi:hypothetical protein
MNLEPIIQKLMHCDEGLTIDGSWPFWAVFTLVMSFVLSLLIGFVSIIVRYS